MKENGVWVEKLLQYKLQEAIPTDLFIMKSM